MTGIHDLNLVFRPVRPDDKTRVLEFTAKTWSDGDYIAEVFDDWLADPGGQFTAVLVDEHVVAIGKLTDLGDGELWLEGLRVDPEHRKKGIGEALHNYNVDLARKMKGRVLRYATGDENVVSKLFAARTGFIHVGNYWWHEADAIPEFDPPAVLTPDDWPALKTRLHSPLIRSKSNLYAHHWRWRTLSEERLQAHLSAGEVVGLRRRAGLRAWSICAWREVAELSVQHLDAIDAASLADMARSLRRMAADAGRSKVTLFALEPSALIGALREAGYSSDEFSMVIFELPLVDG